MPRNILTPGQVLYPDDSLVSSNGKYQCIYQNDGNLCVYKLFENRGCTWASNTYGVAAPGRAIMQDDGNFVLYSSDGKAVAASNTVEHNRGNVGSLIMQDDGNLVMYQSNGNPRWASWSAKMQRC
jgi:hypothetical protein